MPTIPEDLRARELNVRAYIEEYAKLFEIDPNLVRALITQESRFISNATSPTGAFGYGQFTNIACRQVQNIAAMTPKAADLKNFTKSDAGDDGIGIKAICATLWWLYYRKYSDIADKKIKLEAVLTFYNAGGKPAALVIQHGGHAQALPHIRQLPPQYRSQADKYAPEVSIWYIAWHEVLEKEKQAAPAPQPTPVDTNPFGNREERPRGGYVALVEALKLLAAEDDKVEIILQSRDGLTELTLILPGEY